MDKIYQLRNRILVNPVIYGIRRLSPVPKPVLNKFSQIILLLEDF